MEQPAHFPASLEGWLSYQEQLHPHAIELGLARVRAVAERLGVLKPSYLSLIVAGTNGKGSSATLLAGIYRASGYRVGLYTSPHLLRYNERIAIDGVMASDEALCAAFARIESARGSDSLTYFEFGTLAALLLFADAKVDVQVLEVGLGGRLDAVNLIDADGVLLTSIALDHMDWLGPDREAIGREKAGVFRRDRPLVCADPDPPQSVLQAALELETPLLRVGQDFGCAANSGQGAMSLCAAWAWWGAGSRYDALPVPGISGAIQLRNAAGVLALIAALQSHMPVPETAIRSALPALRLRGRGERYGDVILDVAHNGEAVEVLVARLRGQGLQGRVRVVLAMLADKPVEAVAASLVTIVTASYCAALPPPRGLSMAQMAERAAVLSPRCFETVAEAYAAARADLQAGECIVVCGSFLTVAEVAKRLDE